MAGRRPACVLPWAALLLVVAGCRPPTPTHGQPRLRAAGERLYLTVQKAVPPGAEPRFLLFGRLRDAPEAWEEEGERFGRVVGLYDDEDRLGLVFDDGTVMRRLEKGKLETVYPGRGARDFLAAGRFGNATVGVRLLPGGRLALVRLEKDAWTAFGAPLDTVGQTLRARLTVWNGAPLLFRRLAVGGAAMPGFGAWLWKGGRWIPFAPPESGERGDFDLLAVEETLFLAEEPTAAGLAVGAPLLWRYADGAWSPAARVLPLPPAMRMNRGLGVALAPGYAARADTAGVHLFRLHPFEGQWSLQTTLLAADAGWGELAGMTVIFVGLMLSFVLLHRLANRRKMVLMQQIEGRTGALPLQPGAIAAPFDRAMAFTIDFLLALPLPVAFYEFRGGVDPFAHWEEEKVIFFLVWLAGVSLYAAVAEARWGQTVGKRLLHLRVRSVHGGRVSAGQALLRNLLRGVDFFPIMLGEVMMPYLVALGAVTVSRRRQRLGDLFAGTVVRRTVPLPRRSLVLASASPRRRALLEGLGVSFTVLPPEVDETLPADVSPEEAVTEVAKRKAKASADRLEGEEIVIAADTVVLLDTEILGKPADRGEAERMLRRLSGTTHRVITGVTVIDRGTGQAIAASDTTEVELRPLSEEEVRAYVESGEADGKAGAYAIQETADRFVRSVHGSLSNVIGLPMELLREMLEDLDG